jgi:hypothetical protein
MEKEMPKVKVIDQQTEQVLFECSIKDSEKAYQFAAEMEEMGLDVKVISPTLNETLSSSLGLTRDQVQTYNESIEEEMNGHDGSCCFTDDEKKTIH